MLLSYSYFYITYIHVQCLSLKYLLQYFEMYSDSLHLIM